MRDKIKKILEKNISKHLYDFGVGKTFKINTKSIKHKKIDKLTKLKLRSSIFFQKTSLREKYTAHRGEEATHNIHPIKDSYL